MKEFLLAALPWIALGVSLALICANYSKNKKSKAAGTDEDQKQPDGNYMTEGICFGMCAGVVLSTVGIIELGLGISLGMLLGIVVGRNIKK